jgi:hypothetical protein
MYGYKINDEDYDASSPYVQPRLYIPVESSPAVSGAVAALAVVQSNGGTYVGGSGYSNRGVIGRYRGHDDSGNIQAWRQWELFAGYQIPANGNWVVGANMSNTGSSTPNGAASGATQISDKKWHVIAMRFVPSTEVSVYLDGKKDGTNTTSIISSVYTGGSPPLEIGWQFAATAITPAQPYALHGSLAFVCWWNTIIPSDAMMCDLTRDPYQILIPA